jgi:hypothetical protein
MNPMAKAVDWIIAKLGMACGAAFNGMVWASALYLTTKWLGVSVSIAIFKSQVQ